MEMDASRLSHRYSWCDVSFTMPSLNLSQHTMAHLTFWYIAFILGLCGKCRTWGVNRSSDIILKEEVHDR